MRAFKDSNGREWEIKITIGAAARVQDLLGVNILGGGEKGVQDLTALYTDTILSGKVICCLLDKQAKERKVDLLEEMGAEDFSLAREAFLEELENFFRASRREDFLTACAVLKQTVKEQIQAAAQNLQNQYGNQFGRSQEELE